MTDPAPAPSADQVITDDQLRAEMERDPHLLHRLRADEERAYDAIFKAHVRGSDYLKKVQTAISTGRGDILKPKSGGKFVDPSKIGSTDLAEARHILLAIATYRAIQEGAPSLHKRPDGTPAINVDKPSGAAGFIPRAMRSYRRGKKMADEPPNARTMTDAEYKAAKAKLLKDGHVQRRANDDAAELRRITARYPERKPPDA